MASYIRQCLFYLIWAKNDIRCNPPFSPYGARISKSIFIAYGWFPRTRSHMFKSGIDVCEQHERLPSFYWLPKLHKTPYGTRFIAASNRCTTKQLSALLTSCFKTIITHFKQYCNGIYKNTVSKPLRLLGDLLLMQ